MGTDRSAPEAALARAALRGSAHPGREGSGGCGGPGAVRCRERCPRPPGGERIDPAVLM